MVRDDRKLHQDFIALITAQEDDWRRDLEAARNGWRRTTTRRLRELLLRVLPEGWEVIARLGGLLSVVPPTSELQWIVRVDCLTAGTIVLNLLASAGDASPTSLREGQVPPRKVGERLSREAVADNWEESMKAWNLREKAPVPNQTGPENWVEAWVKEWEQEQLSNVSLPSKV